MKVIEPGHIYLVEHQDGTADQTITFVNRESGTEHEGTQTQEILRVNIHKINEMIDAVTDRTNHCDGCMRWEGNDRIVKAFSEAQRQLRLGLLYHEQRAMERKLERGKLNPEDIPVAADGHFELKR